MSTATARVTLGSIFGAVNSATTSVASLFDTTTQGIGMLNKAVTVASTKQNLRCKADLDGFVQALAEDKAMEEAVRKNKVENFVKNNDLSNHFSTAYQRIITLLESEENKDTSESTIPSFK